MWPVRPLRVNNFFEKFQGYVWYQDDISLANNRLVGPFQFGKIGRNKIKYLKMIDHKQRRKWRKKDGKRESTLQIPKKLCHWGGDSISVNIVGFAYFTF